MQASNSSYTLHNVEIQNYPVVQESVLVSTYTESQKNCVRDTCYRHILKYSETIKFHNVSSAVANLIAYEKQVTLVIDGTVLEYAKFKSYNESAKSLTLSIIA